MSSKRWSARWQKPARPLVAIVAGSKVSTKLTVLESLLAKVDQLIVGGGIANTFLAATGVAVGKSLYEEDMLDIARRLLEQAKARGAADSAADRCGRGDASSPPPRTPRCAPVDEVRPDEMILDIGPDTAEQFAAHAANRPAPSSGMARWGYSNSTSSARARARSRRPSRDSKAFSLAGGGDTLAAIEKYGVEEGISYISTGGGAFLEFVEGKTLPAVAMLEQRAADPRPCPAA